MRTSKLKEKSWVTDNLGTGTNISGKRARSRVEPYPWFSNLLCKRRIVRYARRTANERAC